MKEKPTKNGIVDQPHTEAEARKNAWWERLVVEEILNKLPNFTRTEKGMNIRISVPVHHSTETIVTQIREKYPQKFRINLDVYKSMLYAGRQLFEYVYLSHSEEVKKSRGYKMAKILESVEQQFFDRACLETFLEKLLEGYLSHVTGDFSRDKILAKIDEMRPLLSPELQERCDIFIDEELDSDIVKQRVRDRLRQREYRKNKKNIHLVNE
jgi:hypothetical protein